MIGFLRYNSRHSVWFPRGWRGMYWPQLNPITSCSHNDQGQHTWSFSEPSWLYLIRRRIFSHAGRQRCGERGTLIRLKGDSEFPDTWDYGPDGNRTCSFCGSIHFDDLMAIARKVPTDDRYGVEGTTKSYKRYVRHPNVRNASEGAIKFYMTHAPNNPSEKDQKDFADAVRITSERFRKQLEAMRAPK